MDGKGGKRIYFMDRQGTLCPSQTRADKLKLVVVLVELPSVFQYNQYNHYNQEPTSSCGGCLTGGPTQADPGPHVSCKEAPGFMLVFTFIL